MIQNETIVTDVVELVKSYPMFAGIGATLGMIPSAVFFILIFLEKFS